MIDNFQNTDLISCECDLVFMLYLCSMETDDSKNWLDSFNFEDILYHFLTKNCQSGECNLSRKSDRCRWRSISTGIWCRLSLECRCLRIRCYILMSQWQSDISHDFPAFYTVPLKGRSAIPMQFVPITCADWEMSYVNSWLLYVHVT